MDTPDPGVVKDSQPVDSQLPLSTHTPKSAGFGSPKATQDSWTAPRRSQVRQKAKASFLADDDNGGEEADEQDNNDPMPDPREQFDDGMNLGSTTSEPDSVPDRQSDEGEDVFDRTPTPHASQAARVPPQSAQPIPRSSGPGSSDPFSVFEALKKHPPAAVASKKSPQQKQTQTPGSPGHGKTATQGKEEPRTKEATSRTKKEARSSLPNRKVKLSALELEGETETGLSVSHRHQGYDYSLPASNSNSPATSPAKKKAAPKRQAVKKPVPKANAREAKTASTAPVKRPKAPSAGRVIQAKAESAPSFHLSPGEEPEDENGNMELEEQLSIVKPAPRQEQTRGKLKDPAMKQGSPAKDENEDHITISSGSVSSFPESDNTDDEDFECTGKMTPAHARRRTRAAAAQSQARKEGTAKVEDKPAPVSNSRRPAMEGNSRQSNVGVRSKAQQKKPAKKAAVGEDHSVAAPAKSTSEPSEEVRPSTEKPKGKNSPAERRAAASRVTKNNSHVKQDDHAKQETHVKQDPFVPSNVRPAGRRKPHEAVQTSELAKPPESSVRKPNIVAFGPGGPRNNGRLAKTTASTDSRPQDQQISPSDGRHHAPSQTRPAKGSQTAPKMHLKSTGEDRNSPREKLESDEGRSGRTSKPSSGRIGPGHATVHEANKHAVLVHPDADTTEPNYEAEWADMTDTFVGGDAEDNTLVETTPNTVAHSQGQQKQEAAEFFVDDRCAEKLESPAQQIEHPRMGEHRTVLREIDTNPRSVSKYAPTGLPHLLKRKLPEVTAVTEASPKQQPLASKNGFQTGNFRTSRIDSAALPLEDKGQPLKKPRYNSARPFQAHEVAGFNSNPFRGADSLLQTGGFEVGDDIFGPGRKVKPFGPSAFVQRLISSESADRGPGQVGYAAPASSDRSAVPRQSTAAFHHPTTARSVAPRVMATPAQIPQMEEMSKRMRAALESEDPRGPHPLPPSDEPGRSFVVDDMKGPWPNDPSEQSKASELDERTRAWKKATEPYAESLGETMHRIVNTILRGLKAHEAAIDDVVEDYRSDGQRVVERIAEKHRKERALVAEQQEQERVRHLQAYGEARHVTETALGKLESVDIDKILLDTGKSSATNRLRQLKQRIRDA